MKTKSTFPNIAAIALLGLGFSAAHSFAIEFTFSGSGMDSASGNALSANAIFDITGNDLSITLQNTGVAATRPGDVLTSLYFNLNGSPVLTPVSAALGREGSLLNPGFNSGSVGGNWEYMNIPGPHGATEGLSTTSIGSFGPRGNFGPASGRLGGITFGLVNGLGAHPGSRMGNTLVNDSLVFNFTLPTGYDLTSISDVEFQYGTSSAGPLVRAQGNSVPDGGSTVVLLGAALATLALFSFSQKKREGQEFLICDF